MNPSEPVQIMRKVTFGKPVIGPRDYVSSSGSGWPERFPKKESDKALVQLVGCLQIDELVDNFQEYLDLKRDGKANWYEVTSYLGRVFDIESDSVPYGAAISFWARLVITQKAKEQSKCQTASM